MLKNLKVRGKIILPIGITLVVLVAAIVVFAAISVNTLAGDLTDERVQGAANAAAARFADIGDRFLIIAGATAGDYVVNSNLMGWNAYWAENPTDDDRDENISYRQIMLDYLTNLARQYNIDSFVLRDSNFNIVLRTHSPNTFGDVDAGAAAVAAIERGETSSAFNSTGTMPLGMSTQAPIWHDGQIIGSITALYFLHTNEFVDEFAEIFNAEVVVFGAEGGYTSVASTFVGPDGSRMLGTEVEDPEVLDVVLEQGQSYLTSLNVSGEPFHAYYMPLRHFAGHPIGMLFVGFSNQATVSETTTLIMALLIIGVVGLTVAVLIAWRIANGISKPLIPLSAFMTRAGTEGDLTFNQVERETIERVSGTKDEIGQTIGAIAGFFERLNEINGTLEKITDGNLTMDVRTLGAKDTMGVSLEKMVQNLNSMFGEINMATGQVASGSKQLADGAQALAQGSTQQSAAIEELSASITDIADKTKTNAEMAGEAASLAGTIMQNAEKGNRQMDEMTAAVREINQASNSISKVIKVIDDIAFQTNILALNAAVEAARAGQHGKGFAVVAEEVRNLAAKSAEAAKDTGGLISNSMEKAELGARIADDTAASLAEIVSGIAESSRIVAEIAKSSEEQTVGISQINIGIDQVAQVVQQNSATAEESAAASEEMSGQSAMLEELISQFKLKNSERINRLPPPQNKPREQLTTPQKTTHKEISDFGKY